jgi:hypothetical protein
MPSRGITGKLSVDTNPAFTYPDMEMYWSSRGQLLFRVHMKPYNQQLLYLNRGSSNTSSCYRATDSGVLCWLAELTSATVADLGRPMHQLYPEHWKALQHAGLCGICLRTLKQVLDSISGASCQSRSRCLEQCFSVLVIPDSGRLQSMCCYDAFVTNTIYFGFESQCLTTVSAIFMTCFRGTWTEFSWRMLNQKTIVTALVIAQAGGAVTEMFAKRHSL